MLLIAAAPALAQGRAFEVGTGANVYLRLGDATRLFLLADLTEVLHERTRDAEIGAHLDLAFKPILRRRLRGADWERDRYLWVRVGYGLIGDLDDRESSVTEHRALVEATMRVPLPGNVWVANRVRVDRRDLDGERSTWLRERLGIELEVTTAVATLVPYVQGEIFRDTRFGSWNRQRYEAGVEIELTPHLRVEASYTRQEDQRSSTAHLDRVGLALKFYY